MSKLSKNIFIRNAQLLAAKFEQKFLNGFEDLNRYSFPTKGEKIRFFLQVAATKLKLPSRKIELNFLVTSKAEIRIFSPLISTATQYHHLQINIIALRPKRFSRSVEKLIDGSKNISRTRSIYPIVLSCIRRNHRLNVICLDHKSHEKAHSLGILAAECIKKTGGRSVCLQHGGLQTSNIEGHANAVSTLQIVWGYRILQLIKLKMKSDNTRFYVTGNPLHDSFHEITSKTSTEDKKLIMQEVGQSNYDKKVILVATCLHTEYDNRADAGLLYRAYIRKIYDSVNLEEFLLVVKMHPADSLDPNIYAENLSHLEQNDVLILPPDDERWNVYRLIALADLVITRASSVAEESLLIGKPVIAFDLFFDGPSSNLQLVNQMPNFKLVVGLDCDLAAEIESSRFWKRPSSQALIEFQRDVTLSFDGKSSKRTLDRVIRLAEGKT